MLSLLEIRQCVRKGRKGWERVRDKVKGPCGAVSQALVELGYADKLHWCETRQDDASTWFSHWVAKKDGKIVDASGVFYDCHNDILDCTFPFYRRMTRRRYMWPYDYTLIEVEYWVRRIRRWEKRK